MSKKRKSKAKSTVTKPSVVKPVWGHDSITHKRLHLLPGTPGFTPDK